MEIKINNTDSAEFINFNSALSQMAFLIIIDKTSISVHMNNNWKALVTNSGAF